MKNTTKKLEPPFLYVLMGFILCGAFAGCAWDRCEGGEDRFVTPFFGWGHTEKTKYSFAVPFYSRHQNKESGNTLTLIYPLLTGMYEGQSSDKIRLTSESTRWDASFCLPLLAMIGEYEAGKQRYSGYFSPLLSTGSYQWNGGDDKVEASGLALPFELPLVDHFPALHLYSSATSSGLGGDYACWEALAIPGIDFSLFDSRSAGIEEEFKFGSIWNIHLYRSSLNLPGCGYMPGLDELSAHRVIHHLSVQDKDDAKQRIQRLSKRLNQRLDEARSGSPIEHTGLLDPMLVYESCGEELFGLGFEPLFYYAEDEGFSLPFLLTSFTDDGVKFGNPAFKHLFPIVHGNRDGTRYDFLAHWGSYYDVGPYSALDLKLLFNYQHHDGRGTAWGFLPYFFGDFPGRELNHEARFVQFPAHVFAWWDLDGELGCELLAPFLFSYTEASGRADCRILLLFGFESDEASFEFDFCGIPLISKDG